MSPATKASASQPPAGALPHGDRSATIKAVPVRHPWRWVAAVVILVIAAEVIGTIVTSGIHWDQITYWLHQSIVLQALVVTLELTVIAMAVGIVLGVTLAVMRLSPNPVVSIVSWLYIWFFRGTPVLVQIFFWFNLNVVLRHVGIGIPFTHVGVQADTNSLINPFVAVCLGLGLNEAAYMAEIVRAGIISVEQGQTEAAQALGMRRLLIMRRVILPQAMRVIIPPTGNETISMLKTTSLAFVAAVPELFTRSEQIASSTFLVIEMAFVASIWYLVVTSILTVGQYYLERYFARGSTRQLPLTPLQRFRLTAMTFHGAPPVDVLGPVASVQRRDEW